jgi:hypothetical protein
MAKNKVARVPDKSGSEVTFTRDDETGAVGRVRPGVFSDTVEDQGVAVDTDAEAADLARRLVNEPSKEEKDP